MSFRIRTGMNSFHDTRLRFNDQLLDMLLLCARLLLEEVDAHPYPQIQRYWRP